MQITSSRWPFGISVNCPSCTSLGYTTTVFTAEGDVVFQQTVVNGTITGLTITGSCPACGSSFTVTRTVAQLQTLMATVHPSLRHQAIAATLAGQAWTAPTYVFIP